jgi:hypothetical protein
LDKGERSQLSRLVVTRSVDFGLLMDLGRQGRGEIKRLKRSNGLLAEQIQKAVEERLDQLSISSSGEVVPVVFLYRVPKADDGATEPRDWGDAGE